MFSCREHWNGEHGLKFEIKYFYGINVKETKFQITTRIQCLSKQTLGVRVSLGSVLCVNM